MSEERPKIRWARGFLRVWFIVFVLWAVPSFYYNYDPKYICPERNLRIGHVYYHVGEEFYTLNNEKKQETVDEIISSKHSNTEDWPTSSDRKSWHLSPRGYSFKSLTLPIEWSLIPPIALLVFGYMIGWAISGFKRA
ncbi:MAG: hypothetical protein ABF646_02230 [Acetobacter papayae]